MQLPRFSLRPHPLDYAAPAMQVCARYPRRACLVALLFAVSITSSPGEDRGVIHDPDGYVNLRSGQSTASDIVAKVKANEVFTFEPNEESDWCNVKLRSGKTGWMHRSRIRLYFTEADLPQKPKKGEGESEIDELARSVAKVDYHILARKAAQGDPKSQKTFFGLADHVDGAASESYYLDLTTVLHLLGDEKLSGFLSSQPIDFQMSTRSAISGALGLAQTTPQYVKTHFPKTFALFSRRELLGWPSPDGRFAIRKVFSDTESIHDSKVTLAELIEKSTGKVLLDLTRDDIGVGGSREGSVLWAPDSKRFASLSMNLQVGQGNLFSTPPLPPTRKQTTVYQNLGEGFSKVEIPLDEPPGKKDDPEIKDAKVGHEYVEPVRWEKPNVLILQRHDYYEALRPDRTINPFGRLWEITVTFAADGTPDVKWKRDDR